MDLGFVQLIASLTENGLLSVHSLQILILAVSFHGYWNYIRPMKHKVDDLPDINEMKEALYVHAQEDNTHFAELKVAIDAIEKLLYKIEQNEGRHNESTKDIQQDIELIKHMLSQFQGHMMYGSGREFGNRELK